MNFLRQSTNSQSRAIGPFVDDTDFKTAKTGLTIANTDIKLIANGGSSANKNSGGGTHRVNGLYGVTFDATDTATVGELEVSVVVAGALPVFKSFFVIEPATYDALFADGAVGYVADQPVNVTKVGGTTQTARDLGASVLLSVGTGTGQVNLASGKVPATIAAGDIANNAITAASIAANALTAAKIDPDVTTELQSGLATASALATLQTSVDDLPTNAELATALAAADDAVLAAIAALNNLSAAGVRAAVGLASANLDTQLDALPTAAENADAVWDEAIAGHAVSGSTGEALAAAGAAGDPWITALPGAYSAGQAGKIVGDFLNAAVGDVPTNAELATALAAADDAVLAAIPTTAQIADKILGRSIAGGADGGRTVQDALRPLRNKTSIAAGTMTVCEEDDSTPAWTAAVTTTPGDPLSAIDPA